MPLEKPRWVVQISNCAIATSGNYRQYVTIDGNRYSHIINPLTGRPAEKIPSVTVIAPLAIDADALATAISVMGPEKGMELIESLPQTEALLVTSQNADSQVSRSSGFSKYEVSLP